MDFEPLISNLTGRDTTGLGARRDVSDEPARLATQPAVRPASEPDEQDVDVEFEALWERWAREQRW